MYLPNYLIPGVEFSSKQRCSLCRQWHTGRCSQVKKIEYNEDNTIKTIEFFDKELKNDSSNSIK